jgi:Glycosyltransferase sugar-binding region containing DXD motif
LIIPKLVHFCWIGSRLPWAYAFAVISASARGGMDEVILHHTDELEDGPVLRALRQTPGVRLSRTDPWACLAPVQAELGLAERLTGLYDRLSSPVMRADVMRAAILHSHGGIYLDLDTLTVAPLTPLLGVPHFIGLEYIVWPRWVRSSRSPLVWARHLSLDVMRKAMRRAPQGWRAFRLLQGLYFCGVNNAVMGGMPGAPLFAAYLRAMAALPPAHLAEPYALGPDLLQAIVDSDPPPGLTIHAPGAFYPLPPEISEHWFRRCPHADAVLGAVLSPDTRVAHWYASVRTRSRVAQISPAYVRAHRHGQLYSALVSATLPELPADA